jgi:hypothetical protein
MERLWATSNGVDIARRDVPGAYSLNVFGQTEAEAGVPRFIREPGTPDDLVVPKGIQLTAVSSDAADTQRIRIRYLDSNLIENIETIQLAGTTPVTTQASDIRAVNGAYSIDGLAVGDITLTGDDGFVHASIPSGEVQFNTTLRRVPAGHRYMVTSLIAGSASGSSDAKCLFKFEMSFIENDSFAEDGVFVPEKSFVLQDSSESIYVGNNPIVVPEGEWYGFRVTASKVATVTASTVGWMERT